MATNYPTSKDDGTSLPNPTGSSTQNNPDHAGLHSTTNAAVIAVETKLGTGSSTPASNQLLFGTGAGTSAWQSLTSSQLASVLSDETGTGSAVFANTPVLITPKVDTIQENTVGNGVTVAGVNIKSSALTTANSVPTAALQDSSVTSAKAATGFVVQVLNTTTSAVATGTTVIPTDDTIPQITEGNEYMTLSITPKATTNVLIIEAGVYMSHSTGGANLTAALFQDATANALAVDMQYQNTATAPNSLVVKHVMTAATTSSTTFRLRAGAQNAGTTTFNGNGGTRNFGAAVKSWLIITEYKG